MAAGRRYFFKQRRRPSRLPALLLSLGLLLAGTGAAEGRPALAPVADTPETACLTAIRAAERGTRLPSRLLLAVGVTEAGRTVGGRLTVWPWTVNAEGQGHYFPDKPSAIRHVQALRARGVRSIDVGCMQVNLHWHPDAFPDLDTAFDPAANVAYAAALLKRHHGDLRNWTRSVKRYHSATADRGQAYFDRVSDNLRLVMQRRNDLADMPVRPIPARRAAPAAVASDTAPAGAGSLGAWNLPRIAGSSS